MWYAIADAVELGFELEPHEARELCEVGEAIRVAAREQVDGNVSIVQIAGPWQGVNAVSKNAVVISPGRLDRSATGTGLSARMAVLHARGLMQVGDVMTHASPIGSTFDGHIVAGDRRRDRPGDSRQRVHHRPHRAVRRRARSVPAGLPAE